MKQTLNFENDAYRRLCGEILERRHPGRWIICGSIAATLTAVAVSLTMAAGSSTAAVSSPVRANASEPDRVTAYAELPPEIITRTHTETVTVPVTQELVTVVQSQPETLPTVAAVQETVEPETEPLPAEQPVISSQNPDFAQNVLRTERYTFVNQGVFLVLDNETNKLVHFNDKYTRSMWWTGTELLMYSDTGDSYLYSPDDNTYTTLDSRELAELVQYQWTCNGERYSFYAYDNTLYRRQESNGKETALYQNPKGLKISCISGSYLFLVEKTDSDNYYLGDSMVSRVNLLTGEKERLFNCDGLSYRGESGGDVLFEMYCGTMVIMNVRVHPDGTYESYRLYPGGYGDDQRATVTAFDRSEHTWTVDVTEELRKLVPDIEEWQMYNHIVEIDGDELFCCEMDSELADMTGALSGSVVYIGRRTENGLVGGLHVFRDTPSSIIYADGHNAYYTKSTWNDSTGNYDKEIITIPYDRSASSDSAE